MSLAILLPACDLQPFPRTKVIVRGKGLVDSYDLQEIKTRISKHVAAIFFTYAHATRDRASAHTHAYIHTQLAHTHIPHGCAATVKTAVRLERRNCDADSYPLTNPFPRTMTLAPRGRRHKWKPACAPHRLCTTGVHRRAGPAMMMSFICSHISQKPK
jgi:hypothetical protein